MYVKFTYFYDLNPFPATPETLSSFIKLIGFSVKSHKTVNNYLSALRRLHDLSGFDSAAFDDIKVKLTLKGLEKTKRHIPVRKLPITPDMLLKFCSHLDFRNSAHLALWAALLVGFFTFFRTANLCPTSRDTFSAFSTLSRNDITFTSWGAEITVTWTKTRQSGDTALVVSIPRIPNSVLCTVRALNALFQAVDIPASAPAFSYLSTGHRLDCITASIFRSSIQLLASRIGLEPRSCSGHSLRRGGATFAFQCGIPAELIKIQGDWRSDACLLYLMIPLADRLVLTQTLAYHVGQAM